MSFAAIFDCDGVLVDSEILALEIELAGLAELGLHFDLDDYMGRCLGLTGPAWYALLEDDHLRVHNRPLPREFRSTCDQQYRAAMASERLVEVSGARAFVANLACPKAVASSSSIRSLESKLRRTGMWDHFAPHVYSGEQVPRGKPEPDLFLHVANCLRVDPKRCLVIEDSINGVRAARAAGMRVWGFLGAPSPPTGWRGNSGRDVPILGGFSSPFSRQSKDHRQPHTPSGLALHRNRDAFKVSCQ